MHPERFRMGIGTDDDRRSDDNSLHQVFSPCRCGQGEPWHGNEHGFSNTYGPWEGMTVQLVGDWPGASGA